MTDASGNGSPWDVAVENARLGLPIGATGRHLWVRRMLARLLWPFFKRQIDFNTALLSEFVAVRNDLASQIEDGRRALSASEAAASSFVDRLIADFSKERGEETARFGAIEETLVQNYGVLVRFEETLAVHETSLGSLSSRFQLIDEKIDLAQRQSFARYHDGIGAIREEIASLQEQLAEQDGRLVEQDGRRPTRDEMDSKLDQITVGLEELRVASARSERTFAELRSRLTQFDLLLDQVRRRLPAPVEIGEFDAGQGALGVLYGALEDAFRGSEEDISARSGIYVEEILTTPEGAPVLDVGCGRGELLRSLSAAGVRAYGIDINPAFVDPLVKQGFDARLAGAVAHLESIEPGSLRAVTAVHVVEHLETEELMTFLGVAFRALCHGGVLMLETPNPDNLVVGASSFYLDPTHRHPLPPALLSFLVESRGFADVEVRYPERTGFGHLADPSPDEPWSKGLEQVVEVLNRYLFAPPDFVVVARRL